MNSVIERKISLEGQSHETTEKLKREWLTTNGIGGYASGTVSGKLARRYHGVLIAALSAPLGRVVMLNHLEEVLRLPDGRRISLQPDPGSGAVYLEEFRLDFRMPVWRYEVEGIIITKRLVLVHGQNTAQLTYALSSAHDSVTMELHPSVQFRRQEAEPNEPLMRYTVFLDGRRFEVAAPGTPYPVLRLFFQGSVIGYMHTGNETREVTYDTEAERGYSARGLLWNSGYFLCELKRNRDLNMVASTEPWEVIDALQPATAYALEVERCQHLLYLAKSEDDRALADLVLAADQFVIAPVGRVEDGARARAIGDDVRTIIAGYHWFTDWGRDTMISLEGLTLSTGRASEAEWILRAFAHYIRDGLIPNMFPEGKNAGLYHTADATLWFFHALDRYVEHTGDKRTLQYILPRLRDVIKHHISGTLFHIGMDPKDGLLRQGQEGYQLTWMDAKMGDWVVTPRRGKAVEINALWYNALRLLEQWSQETGDPLFSQEMGSLAGKVERAFNERFWNESAGYLFDVVDGDDPDRDASCRPNQIFAFSLRYPVLDRNRWSNVLRTVRDNLLTPYGLRSLSPKDPDYKARYFGDLRARDGAYHQGTVWGWLIGPYIDAFLRVYPDSRDEARQLLQPLIEHMGLNGLGSISEVFDAQPPYTPRGCIAQAWSVAEVLRCLSKTSATASSNHSVEPRASS